MSCCLNSKECYSVDYRELENLSYNITVKLSKLADYKMNNLMYKYECPKNLEKDFKKLTRYKDALDRFRLSLLKGYKTCLSECELQSLKERILDYIPKLQKGCRLDVIVDDSNAEQWIENFPECVSREPYEKLKYYSCEPMKFKVAIVEEKRDCEACEDIKFNVSIKNEESCELGYKAIIENLDCDIKYDVYLKALECGISYEYIVETLKCGHTISYNVEQDKCEINFNFCRKQKR